jgi:hypothetical protein
MSNEIDPNLKINSDLFPSFKEGFSAYPEGTPIEEQIYDVGPNHQDPNYVRVVCCDGCTCENSHAAGPFDDSDTENSSYTGAIVVCCDECTCTTGHLSILYSN